MVQSMKIYWKMIGNYYRPLEVTVTEKKQYCKFVSKESLPIIYTDFTCTPNFADNVSVLNKAVEITSTLLYCKLTLIKAVTNTDKTFTVQDRT